MRSTGMRVEDAIQWREYTAHSADVCILSRDDHIITAQDATWSGHKERVWGYLHCHSLLHEPCDTAGDSRDGW